jgi:hypothetical protein
MQPIVASSAPAFFGVVENAPSKIQGCEALRAGEKENENAVVPSDPPNLASRASQVTVANRMSYGCPRANKSLSQRH